MGRARRAKTEKRSHSSAPAPHRHLAQQAGALDRFLALAGEAGDAGGKIGALRTFLLMHGAARSWLWLTIAPDRGAAALDTTALQLATVVLTAAFVLSLLPRLARLGPRLALVGLSIQLAVTFPLTDNHFFVELLAVLALASLDTDDRVEAGRVVQTLMWMTALIFFQTGLQKVLYGHYVHGDFIAFMVGRGGRFADLFTFALSSEEIARLQGYNPLINGSGPYRPQGWAIPILSNAIYLAEMALPPLLLIGRTRTAAALAGIAVVAVIQLGAREIAFALLFINLLILFLPGPWNRRALPALACLYAWALGASFGLWPGGSLIDPTIL